MCRPLYGRPLREGSAVLCTIAFKKGNYYNFILTTNRMWSKMTKIKEFIVTIIIITILSLIDLGEVL